MPFRGILAISNQGTVEASFFMPPSQDRPEPSDIHQTLRLGSSGDGDGFQLDQTVDSQLYATIKNGTADVANLKVLIPGFEIIEELGRGAFGVVYRARDVKLERQVAIKVSLLDDPSRREQYIREARNAAKLETMGIVPVFQVGALRDGQPFVVQRLIDGSTLRRLLAEQGRLDVRRACVLMRDIAEAVAQAHAVGMIHRDLKPDNILVDSAGKPWVADFGLAILEEDQKQHRGERAGTPLYMSPEQLRGRTEWLDGRTDIYALGIMLYEMLTGRPPFDAQSLAELEEQVLHRDPKPITQRAPHIPASMDVIFQNCCAKQVNERYANAHELVADLQTVLSEMTQIDSQVSPVDRPLGPMDASRRPSTPMPVSERRKTLRQMEPVRTTLLQQPVRSYLRWYVLTTVVVGLASMGLIAFVLWKPKSDPSPPVAKPGPGDVIAGEPGANELPQKEPTQTEPAISPPQNKVPPRPFRVSIGSDGTHSTIAAAIAMASDGEEITILPGRYVESLALDRNIVLVGEGSPDEIVIVGENKNAVSLTKDISVTLRNLTLDCHKSGDLDLNTIDVLAGRLTLVKCNISTRSFDCVKLQPGSGLTATDCHFSAKAHPAISAERTRELLFKNCTFDIRPPKLDEETYPIGVQATDCAGTISGCKFYGEAAAVGIHWEATQQPVAIEDSIFENCDKGIVVQACGAVTIAGANRNTFRGCLNGLLVDRSAATIIGADIESASGEVGLRILDTKVTSKPSVIVRDCAISGFAVGLSVEQAHANINNLHCKNNEENGVQLVRQAKLSMQKSLVEDSEIGVYIEDATAQLSECTLTGNQYFGIWVDGSVGTLASSGSIFRENAGGMLIVSGTTELKGGEFDSNEVGIVIASREESGVKAAGTPTNIFVDLERVKFSRSKNSWLKISTPCRYRQVEIDLSEEGRQTDPNIIGDLKALQVGDVTEVKPSASGGKKL